MQPNALFQDLQQRLGELFQSSPITDLERNVKALLAQTFQRLDLVTREEFEVQVERVNLLQQRIAALEARLGGDTPQDPA